MQFLGKDNVAFHALTFPATLLGSGADISLVDRIKGFCLADLGRRKILHQPAPRHLSRRRAGPAAVRLVALVADGERAGDIRHAVHAFACSRRAAMRTWPTGSAISRIACCPLPPRDLTAVCRTRVKPERRKLAWRSRRTPSSARARDTSKRSGCDAPAKAFGRCGRSAIATLHRRRRGRRSESTAIRQRARCARRSICCGWRRSSHHRCCHMPASGFSEHLVMHRLVHGPHGRTTGCESRAVQPSTCPVHCSRVCCLIGLRLSHRAHSL